MCAWVVAGGAEPRKPDGLLHAEAIRGMLAAGQELKKGNSGLKLRRKNLMKRYWLTVAMGAIGPMLAVTAALGAPDNISFPMVRSSAAMAATSELGDGNRA